MTAQEIKKAYQKAKRAYEKRTGDGIPFVTPPSKVAIKDNKKITCWLYTLGVDSGNGSKMAAWVPGSVLYVRQIENNGKILLVSTEPVKKVYTGRMKASDVHKI